MPSKTPLLYSFGDIIREKRKEKKMSQEDLAFKADLHRTYIGMLERAEKNITLENINKLAKALDLSVSELLKDLKD
jgi:transcriptional regulator with XRE-family HTH domain